MDIGFAIALSFILLLWSASQGVFMGYALLATLGLVSAVLLYRGVPPRALWDMACRGSRRSVPVLVVLLLIGAVIAIWIAAGTVPALVYYGIQVIQPRLFVLWAFLLTSVVSMLIGTSFGSAGTIGLAMMIMARSSDINPNMIAGAVIAGAYVGDRCSPMSSSAVLIAGITETDLYGNLRRMVMTTAVPMVLSCLVYLLFSLQNPVNLSDQTLTTELSTAFQLHPIVVLPALVILVLSLLQVNVKWSMLTSLGIAGAIAIIIQGYRFTELLRFAIVGFRLDDPDGTVPLLTEIMTSGGVLSMLKVGVIVLISTAIAGIFAESRVLSIVDLLLKPIKTRSGLFLSTTLIGIGAAAFGCTQTIAILLTQQLVATKYEENQLNRSNLAIDLENTVVVLAPLIPWNIAGFIPAAILSTGLGFIPYAVYLYLVPLSLWTYFKYLDSFQKTPCN